MADGLSFQSTVGVPFLPAPSPRLLGAIQQRPVFGAHDRYAFPAPNRSLHNNIGLTIAYVLNLKVHNTL